MFSDMPFMCGIVAVVVGVVLSLASVVVVKVGECFVGRSIRYSSCTFSRQIISKYLRYVV